MEYNSNLEYPLMPVQKKLKKSWLMWTVLRQIWIVLTTCVLPFSSTTSLGISDPMLSFETIILSLFQLIVLYFGAYKKLGLGFLGILLLITPFSYVLYWAVKQTFPFYSSYWGVKIIILDLVLFIWWYWRSLKVWNLNCSLKHPLK
jgi:hypothetical protein